MEVNIKILIKYIKNIYDLIMKLEKRKKKIKITHKLKSNRQDNIEEINTVNTTEPLSIPIQCECCMYKKRGFFHFQSTKSTTIDKDKEVEDREVEEKEEKIILCSLISSTSIIRN